MYSQEMCLQVGNRVIVRIPLSKRNGSQGEKDCTGEIINLTENRVRIKLDEGDEVDVHLSDITGSLQGIYKVEQSKSFSHKVFERGLGVIFFLILIIVKIIGFVCWFLSLPLEGTQRIIKRFKKEVPRWQKEKNWRTLSR